MSKQLPARPNLDQLKNQAKTIHKAHAQKDAGVCERLRILRRFTGKPDSEILAAELTLSEAQFMLALEYGFKDWNDLRKRVEEMEKSAGGSAGRRFDRLSDLDALSDKGIQQVLREINAGDLSLAMREVPRALQDRIVGNMSERARGMVWEDMHRFADCNFSPAIFAAAGQVLLDIANGIPDLDMDGDKPRFAGLEDLMALTDRQIQMCLRDLDQEDVVRVMLELSQELRERIFNNMSARATAMVKEDMATLVPEVPLNPEIGFRARRKFVKTANRVVDQGEG